MRGWGRAGWIDAGLGLVAAVAIVAALLRLDAAADGVERRAVEIGAIPATIHTPRNAPAAPVLVIAHGFAGSKQLMQSFALAAARNGYRAVSFDFSGHGRNPAPLRGSITEENGATATLLDDLAAVAAHARELGNGDIAVLGHSMASDIVVRYAQQADDVRATIAVSMLSRTVTAQSPENLLIIAGDWEVGLKDEALRVVELAADAPEPGVTYGDHTDGTARRAVFSPNTEHASVLFSRATLRETVDWLDASFGIERDGPARIDARGPWIMLLLAGVVLMARPLSGLLPRAAAPAAGAALPWRRLWPLIVAPMVATPLVLTVVPTRFLPVLVGDYLAAHFLAYGLLTLAGLAWLRRRQPRPAARAAPGALAVAAVAALAYGAVGLIWPIDTFLTAFVAGPERVPLFLAMLTGTLAFCLATEWATRGPGAARGGYAAAMVAFVFSLGVAVALDPGRLFFLLIIVPVMVPVFVVHGLLSGWLNARTGHPFVAALANAVIFAWAIAVTFPLLAG